MAFVSLFNHYIIPSYCSWSCCGVWIGCYKEECVRLKDRFCEWVMIIPYLDPDAACSWLSYFAFDSKGVKKDINVGCPWVTRITLLRNIRSYWEILEDTFVNIVLYNWLRRLLLVIRFVYIKCTRVNNDEFTLCIFGADAPTIILWEMLNTTS